MSSTIKQRLTLRAGSRPAVELAPLLQEAGLDPNSAARVADDLASTGRSDYQGVALSVSVLADSGLLVERIDEQPIEVAAGAKKAIETAWAAMETVLLERAPEALLPLRPAAASQAIHACVEELGMTLPQDYLAWLTLHDGEAETHEPGPYGYRLTTLAESLRGWRMLTEVLGDENTGPIEADLGVRSTVWSRGWWPFAENGAGDRLCLDLDPEQGGMLGQVIEFRQEDPHRRRVADGFASWLQERAEALASGKLVLIESSNGRFSGLARAEDLERLPLCTERVRGESAEAYRARLHRTLLERAPAIAQYLCRELRARRLLIEDVPHGSVTVSLVAESAEPHLGDLSTMAQAVAKALPGVPGVSLPVPLTAAFIESLLRNVQAGYP